MGSFVTVFDASLGNYEWSKYEIPDSVEGALVYSISGKLYQFILVLLFNILILNFIIAILSNTFGIFEPMSKGLYLSTLLSVRPSMEYD